MKGKCIMGVSDKNEYENYKQEVKEKWGNTAAYKEHEQKTAAYTDEKYRSAAVGLDSVFAAFAQCKKDGNSPDSKDALTLVKRLQDHITNNFYICTNEILASLGQIYVCDERFRASINKHGNDTAEFVSQAIENYCNGAITML